MCGKEKERERERDKETEREREKVSERLGKGLTGERNTNVTIKYFLTILRNIWTQKREKLKKNNMHGKSKREEKRR